MNFENLQASWKNQTAPSAPAHNDEMLDNIRERARRFNRTIFWRDAREVGATFLLVAVFAYVASVSPGPAGWGAGAMVAGSGFIALFLLLDRLLERLRPAPVGDAIESALRENLRALDHQITLLRKVAWWYLLPIDLGLLGWALGLGAASPFSTVFWLVAFGLIGGLTNVYVYRLNQKAVRESLQPDREALAQELADWSA